MKRIILLVVVLVPVCLGLVAWLEPTCTVRGWWKGDAFFAGRSATYWAGQLRESDPVAHSTALRRLRRGGSDALPVLLQLLRLPADAQEVSDVRCRAAELIGDLGTEGRDAVDDLLEAVNDPDEYVRIIAVRSLGKVAPSEQKVVEALRPLLDGPLQAEVLAVLARSGAVAAPARADLVRILEESKDPAQRALAAVALGKLGAEGRPAVAPLREALADESAIVRWEAAEALGRIGQVDDGLVSAVEAVLTDTHPRVRFQAVRALGKFGPKAKAALPAVKRLLQDKDTDVRSAARQAVGRIELP